MINVDVCSSQILSSAKLRFPHVTDSDKGLKLQCAIEYFWLNFPKHHVCLHFIAFLCVCLRHSSCLPTCLASFFRSPFVLDNRSAFCLSLVVFLLDLLVRFVSCSGPAWLVVLRFRFPMASDCCWRVCPPSSHFTTFSPFLPPFPIISNPAYPFLVLVGWHVRFPTREDSNRQRRIRATLALRSQNSDSRSPLEKIGQTPHRFLFDIP